VRGAGLSTSDWTEAASGILAGELLACMKHFILSNFALEMINARNSRMRITGYEGVVQLGFGGVRSSLSESAKLGRFAASFSLA